MESFEIIRALLAFAFVIGTMWGISVLLKKFGYGQSMMSRKDRRLQMVEYLPLDAKNRLVLVARDDVEHLLLVNAEHNAIIETGIKATSKQKLKSKEKQGAA